MVNYAWAFKLRDRGGKLIRSSVFTKFSGIAHKL